METNTMTNVTLAEFSAASSVASVATSAASASAVTSASASAAAPAPGGKASTTPSSACSVCGRAFRRSENLKRHAASHLQERRYQCPYHGCARAFYRTDALNRHKAVHKAAPSFSKFARMHHLCSSKLINCVFASRTRDGRVLTPGNGPAQAQSVSNSAHGSEVDAPQQIPQQQQNLQQHHTQQQQHDQQQQQAILSHEVNVPVCGVTATDISASMVLADSMFTTDMMHTQAAQGQFVEDIPGHLQLLPNLPELTSQVGITCTQRQGPGGCPMPEAYFEPNYLSSLNWLSSQFPFGPGFDKGYDLSHTSTFPLIDTQSPGMPYPTNAAEHLSPQQSDGAASYTTGVSRLAGGDFHRPESNESQGGLYVEGNGSRIPRSGLRKRSVASIADGPQLDILAGLNPSMTQITYGFHETYLESLERPATENLVHDDVYQEILDLYQRTCVSSPIFPPYAAAPFPSMRSLNYMISLHFSNFNAVFPILHPSDVNTSSRLAPLLLVSMAAIGSHYAEVKNAALLSLAMHEFVRRCLVLEDACQFNNADDLNLVYVRIMNCIGFHYSVYQDNKASPQKAHTDLLVHFHQLNACVKATSGPITDINVWRRREMQIRMVALIWLLDTMIGYHFGIPPLIAWNVSIYLPCEESVWEARQPQFKNGIIENMSLRTTLQILYMEKRLPAQAGEFAKICVIHGLYRTLGHVAYTLRIPLHSWLPTAERIDYSSLTLEEHHHRIPIYQKWRNASCDVIDVLHWRAVSIIAVTGTENPTVHHLHFSRIILLTPYESLMRLAMLMAQGNLQDDCLEPERKDIRLWATEDQFKARLAMVHAGVGFWHARRYSTGAFYEAINIFLTTLAIWAYSSFANHPKGRGSEVGLTAEQDDPTASSDDSTLPSFIQLDRPTDDELVQFYVRRGSNMAALISGIGNIHGSGAPTRTLKEGRKILLQMANWGISTRFIWTLTRLIDYSEKTENSMTSSSEHTPVA